MKLDGKKIRITKIPKNGLELMNSLKISPQEALLKINGRVRPEGTALRAHDKIEIIRVIFGG